MLLYIWLAALVAAVYLYCRQFNSRFTKYGVKSMAPAALVRNTFATIFRTKHMVDVVDEQYHTFPGENSSSLPVQFNSRFTKYGVKSMAPAALVRNTFATIFRTKHMVDVVDELYHAFPGEKFIGNYELVTPTVLIRDIELIKKVTVKDFEHFLDHRVFISDEIDPLFGRNLIFLRGQEWKDMRSTLSPAFTSSKMKLMLPFIVEVGNQMVITLNEELKKSKTGYIDIESKDLATHYANDVIATCAFGLKVNSHADPNNEFHRMGHKSTNFGFTTILKFIGYTWIPGIMKRMNMNLFPNDVRDFFQELVLSTMRDREARNILRPDMIHLLMEVKKGRLVHEDNSVKDADAGFATVEESTVGKKSINRAWSDIDLIAQAVIFFIAGFETVSTAMTFLLYELALNPDVQEKLVREIADHDETSGGKFDYNSIQNMKYMDMVVSELLRLWPPVVATDRVCAKEYNLGRPSENATQDFILKKGESVSFPVMAIHRDPRYFPDPLKFNPERFSEENKHNIKPFTYFPFGLGPRNCIGSRFALCEVKVMVYQLLLRYELMPCERTTIPCELAKNNLNLRIKGGHWLRIKPRT